MTFGSGGTALHANRPSRVAEWAEPDVSARAQRRVMDIRDYIRMLRRGWPVVMVTGAIFLGLAVAYLAVTPKTYQSTAVLLVSVNDPASVTDLQQGAQFSANAVTTYAEIIDSSTVLGPVASELRPQRSVDDLVGMVAATVRPLTSLIDVTASGADPGLVAEVANSTAASAAKIIPALESGANGRSLIRVQQIRPAVEPTAPVSPNANRLLALALLAGLAIGVGVTIATQALDTRIRRVHDLRMLTNLPVLAVLPRLSRYQHNGITVRDEPAGAAGEAFRTLRTNVRFLGPADRRSLLLAAVSDGVDGAMVPINLAWVLAEAGHQVLLIDLDLRQSSIGAAMGLPSGAGMADVLSGLAELSAVVHNTSHQNLQVITSGTALPNPSELISAPIMTATLRSMEGLYDYVIVHVPPLLTYTDAAVLSGTAGGTLVTVGIGRTRAQELTTALNTMATVGVNPLGVVLTRASRSSQDHRAGRGGGQRRASWLGPMRHRFDWDWRSGSQKVRRGPRRHSIT